MNSIKRRLGLVAMGAVFALVALEIVIQIVSLVIWANASDDPVHDDGSRVVLCVGDSFTEGMGASSSAAAYPRKLEDLLNQHQQPWRVYNCGLSGSSSRKLLEKLPHQLETYRPNVLVVLTGYNDFWDKPEPLPAGEISRASAGYEWEFKVWKLGKMMLHAIGGESLPAGTQGPSSTAVPFLGAWHSGGTWFRFLPSGRVETKAGDLYWFVTGEKLELRLPAEGKGLEATWKIDRDKLTLAGGPFPSPIELQRGMPERDDVDRGRNALDAGDPDLAATCYRRALATPSLEARARSGLIRALVAQDKRAEATKEVARLQERFDKQPSGQAGDQLADAYLVIGDVDRAVAIAAAMLVDQPITLARMKFLLEHALATSEPIAALPSIERALARDGLQPTLRAALYGGKAQLAKDDLTAFVCLLEAWRCDPKDWLVHKTVLSDPQKYSRSQFELALDEMQLTAAEKDSILAVYNGSFALEDKTTEILAGHLRRVAELARAAGAEPLFLIYPIEKPQVEQAVKAIAAELSVSWLDVRARFQELLKVQRYDELFVLDGHCNDAGYAKLAEFVAESIRRQ